MRADAYRSLERVIGSEVRGDSQREHDGNVHRPLHGFSIILLSPEVEPQDRSILEHDGWASFGCWRGGANFDHERWWCAAEGRQASLRQVDKVVSRSDELQNCLLAIPGFSCRKNTLQVALHIASLGQEVLRHYQACQHVQGLNCLLLNVPVERGLKQRERSSKWTCAGSQFGKRKKTSS